MKTRLLFAVFLIFTIVRQTSAQSWASDSNRWHIQLNCVGGFNGSRVYAYFLKDSLLYDGKIYRQMYETGDTTFQTATPTRYFYREEDSKVFLYRGGFLERLIYDFNLRTGDTLATSDESQIRVLSVDSVTLNDGSRRKRLFIKDDNPYSNKTATWIEGIGSDQAPLDTRSIFFLIV